MSVSRIHHIDYVVRDLDRAVAVYKKILGIEPVAPGFVRDFLETHGEGFFHIAYQVEGIENEAARLDAEGIGLRDKTPRRGLEGWKLVDLDPASTCGVECQLAEPAS